MRTIILYSTFVCFWNTSKYWSLSSICLFYSQRYNFAPPTSLWWACNLWMAVRKSWAFISAQYASLNVCAFPNFQDLSLNSLTSAQSTGRAICGKHNETCKAIVSNLFSPGVCTFAHWLHSGILSSAGLMTVRLALIVMRGSLRQNGKDKHFVGAL